MRLTIIVIATMLISGCLKEDPLNRPFDSYQPREIGDGLNISNPSEQGMDPTKLTSIYSDVYSDENLWSLRSLLVFRNNKLVAESYLKDENDITTQHLIWSCTKQVMGVLTGIAVDNGVIGSIDDPISKYLAEELKNHQEKSGITISQLITMHSGIDYNNEGVSGETDKVLRQIPDNITEFILSRPMRNLPGTDFFYNDGDPQIISSVIQSATGKPVDEWADDVFFSKIGMRNYNWVRYKDGTTLGGFGIETTPRELAKVAICVADSGRYNDQQIVSQYWIKEMLSVKVDIPTGYKFGYYWWYDASRDIHFTWGHGGQFAFIVPSESLIILMTSIPNTQGKYEIQADEALPVVDNIISACF